MRTFLAVLLAFTLSASLAFADPPFYYTGNTLVEHCEATEEGPDAPFRLMCTSFVTGVENAYDILQKNYPHLSYCRPKGVVNDQIRLVVLKWLHAHPEDLHYGGASLVIQALHETFPCEEKK